MEILDSAAPVLWFFGGVAFYAAVKKGAAQAAREKQKKPAKSNKPKQDKAEKRMGAMDRILIVLGAFLLCFIVTMIVIFIVTGSTPDTLIQCVFGLGGLEGGVMGWIKTTKERRQDRRWARQDAREAAKAAGEMEN